MATSKCLRKNKNCGYCFVETSAHSLWSLPLAPTYLAQGIMRFELGNTLLAIAELL
jgi:hypothetical protein